jgi:hypothetical protein
MRNLLSIGSVVIMGAAIAAVAGASRLIAQTSGTPERFTALAVNTTQGGTAQVEIAIDRWSTDQERSTLLKALREQGPEKLLSVLQGMRKVGFIRQTTGIGWDLHYAHREPIPDNGGERIVVGTDRPIGSWEAINQPRTIDYPFTVVELRISPNGEGEGKMTYATKIMEDKKTGSIVLENWGTSPVLLQGVHREPAP